MQFEWDPLKAAANLRVHGVSFAEAVAVLEDDLALTREDAAALDEPRFVTLGLSNLANLLVVLHVPGTRQHPVDFGVESEQPPEGIL